MKEIPHILPFCFSGTPRPLYFGAGEIRRIQTILENGNKGHPFQNPIIITGEGSYHKLKVWPELIKWIQKVKTMAGAQGDVDVSIGVGPQYELLHFKVSGEPTVHIIDNIVSQIRSLSDTEESYNHQVDLIIALGGGSVLDCGKAVAAMLKQIPGTSIADYLEDVGWRTPVGEKIPLLAIPTTAGTGSECTKNAVISKESSDKSNLKSGFKKSLRHDNFIPDFAIIDPELTRSLPDKVTISAGLDAFCQLFESYLSPKSTVLTDALALSGLNSFIPCLERVTSKNIKNTNHSANTSTTSSLPSAPNDCIADSENDLRARSILSYGAMISGITLAHAGLGVVHGLASNLAGYLPIPHGIICSQLLVPAIKMNLKVLQKSNNVKQVELVIKKMVIAANMALYGQSTIQKLSSNSVNDKSVNDKEVGGEGEENSKITPLLQLLERIEKMNEYLRRLGGGLKDYGLTVDYPCIPQIITASAIKNNPVALSLEEIKEILIQGII